MLRIMAAHIHRVSVFAILILFAVIPTNGLAWAENPTFYIASPTVPFNYQEKFHVRGFCLTGETVLPQEELLDFIKDQDDRDLTVSDLYNLANRITQYLRGKGYPAALAYIPDQMVENGIVTIAVLPGRLGEICFNNHTHIPTERIAKQVSCLKPGVMITQASYDRARLLLTDIFGIEAELTPVAGEKPGTTDLIIVIKEKQQRITGAILGDNWSGPYTGRNVIGVEVNYDNFSHLTVGAHHSNDRFRDRYVNFVLPVLSDGYRLNFDYYGEDYTLGQELTDLDISYSLRTYDACFSHAFIRGEKYNLYALLSLTRKQVDDKFGLWKYDAPRTDNLWTIGVFSVANMGWGGEDYIYSGLFCTYGHVNVNNQIAAEDDQGGAKSAGNFAKLNYNYSSLQHLGTNLLLSLRFNAQLANANLDNSEKFSLGGGDNVRAFEDNTTGGDQGLFCSTELLWRLTDFDPEKNDLYLKGFFDCGRVQYYKDRWYVGEDYVTLKDVGIGLFWSFRQFTFECDYAGVIGYDFDQEDHRRIWARAVFKF